MLAYMEHNDKDADLFTLADWGKLLQARAVSPDDGIGFWATSDAHWRESVWRSPTPDYATHVLWFNK